MDEQQEVKVPEPLPAPIPSMRRAAMKRLLLLVGFVVFWKAWVVGWVGEDRSPVPIKCDSYFGTLLEARKFVHKCKKDERYTDMHIFKIGEEVQP